MIVNIVNKENESTDDEASDEKPDQQSSYLCQSRT